ncbi:hypothetical protein PInf_006695 [Phytophthora infestans]|nr:hypothetical protein PInf_006695 [Phytophthora infestans]
MRVGFIVFATMAALLSIVTADSLSKEKLTITSPSSKDTLDGVYIKSGRDKYVVLQLNGDEINRSSLEEDSVSDGKEERAAAVPVNTGTVTKLKTKLKTAKNDFLWHFFRALVPERFRKVP